MGNHTPLYFRPPIPKPPPPPLEMSLWILQMDYMSMNTEKMLNPGQYALPSF